MTHKIILDTDSAIQNHAQTHNKNGPVGPLFK